MPEDRRKYPDMETNVALLWQAYDTMSSNVSSMKTDLKTATDYIIGLQAAKKTAGNFTTAGITLASSSGGAAIMLGICKVIGAFH